MGEGVINSLSCCVMYPVDKAICNLLAQLGKFDPVWVQGSSSPLDPLDVAIEDCGRCTIPHPPYSGRQLHLPQPPCAE
jgi:hypothetical protein